MITYVYETLPTGRKPVRRYEIRQSIKDAPLTKHPTTGEAIRRCIVVSDDDPFVRSATIELPTPRPKKTRKHHGHEDDHVHHHH